MHHRMPKLMGKLGSLDVTKVKWKNCLTALKQQFKGKENGHLLHLNPLLITTYGSGMHCLDSPEWFVPPKSMFNGKQDKTDHDFVANGEVFSK